MLTANKNIAKVFIKPLHCAANMYDWHCTSDQKEEEKT